MITAVRYGKAALSEDETTSLRMNERMNDE